MASNQIFDKRIDRQISIAIKKVAFERQSKYLMYSQLCLTVSLTVCSRMMTSSNGNIFRVTGPLCGEFPSQRSLTRTFDAFFDLQMNKRLSKLNNRDTGDLRCHRALYDVTAMRLGCELTWG